MGMDMGGMMQYIQEIQKKVRDMTVKVTSEDGTVSVIMNGHQELTQVIIGPEVYEKKDAAELSAVIAETFSQALTESKKMLQEEIKKVTGGIGLPPIPGLF